MRLAARLLALDNRAVDNVLDPARAWLLPSPREAGSPKSPPWPTPPISLRPPLSTLGRSSATTISAARLGRGNSRPVVRWSIRTWCWCRAHPQEYAALGLVQDPPALRKRRLMEPVEIITELLDDCTVTLPASSSMWPKRVLPSRVIVCVCSSAVTARLYWSTQAATLTSSGCRVCRGHLTTATTHGSVDRRSPGTTTGADPCRRRSPLRRHRAECTRPSRERDRWGVSYFVVRYLEQFAPVIAQLR